MSVYRLPNQCIKKIDQMYSSFLWSSPAMSAKKVKISWGKVCQPKEEGRLGLRSLTLRTNYDCRLPACAYKFHITKYSIDIFIEKNKIHGLLVF